MTARRAIIAHAAHGGLLAAVLATALMSVGGRLEREKPEPRVAPPAPDPEPSPAQEVIGAAVLRRDSIRAKQPMAPADLERLRRAAHKRALKAERHRKGMTHG